ncbi:unnamed protein product [Penicillium olsonii]|uniref:Complex 1 LYR protein domain-containing protein n=1 Tax=Penicillium olsonii TaxID=99116 RepID=A0A9W4MZE6_PENOL|nr:unnamed protein product [Penicillium olsonii]CAG7932644.1 unnamed protein product [Penicillium olsonii]CAG8005182.1 unnamed protein product [Penicillium olsonii]CAG8082661.1 unnamed protein product [Penicillium olsonii]CAG8235403.1 unnamed protein product [Penicillium olsonii]
MHKVLVPKHSGTHRFACLSLYRALLQQCRSSTETAWLDETRSLVRQNFRKYKILQSPSQTVHALRAGYEALDLISSSHTNLQHRERITDIITQAKSQRDKYARMQKRSQPVAPPPTPLTPKAARKAESIRFQNETSRRHPDAKSVLDRPQFLGGKKRHVPVLVNARGLPFLRFKKPQPRNVSSVIRTKLNNRWEWIQRRDRLKVDLLFAEDEEIWDRMTGSKDLPAWPENTETAIEDVKGKINNFDKQTKDLAQKMWNVVLAERAMAAEEAATEQSEQ